MPPATKPLKKKQKLLTAKQATAREIRIFWKDFSNFRTLQQNQIQNFLVNEVGMPRDKKRDRLVMKIDQLLKRAEGKK